MDTELAQLVLAIVGMGATLWLLASWAGSKSRRYGTKPVRRDKNLLKDVWLDAKSIKSWEENFFAPLPLLLERIGTGLAVLVIVVVLGSCVVVIIAVIAHSR
jgi:hypothetical protein